VRSHSTRRVAVIVGLVGALGVAGCGSDSKSGTPNPKVFVGKLKTTGRNAMVSVAPDLVKGEIDCPTPSTDDAKKIATYACTASTDSGKEVQLSGTSTYDELNKKQKGAFYGTIVVKVDGVEKLSTTCVGESCPTK
jgi:hypothetical protein